MTILVSACLMGVVCRYNAERLTMEHLDELMRRHTLIPVCPEVFGGMSTPREPSELRDGRVRSESGRDVTDCFERGAEEVLRLARLYRCRCAVLKERSPSCGCGEIYDGTFSGRLVRGNGVCAARLLAEGLTVLGESEISKLL
jgi:uncharacterized protein YbbK (DUF523 family)